MKQRDGKLSGTTHDRVVLGSGPVDIQPSARHVDIAPGLLLEWKEPLSADAMGLEVGTGEGPAGGIVRIVTPAVSGWIRLVMTPPVRGDGAAAALLGVRLLLRVKSGRGARTEKVRPILAHQSDGMRQGIRHCSCDLPLQAGTWHELRGLFVVSPDEKTVQLLLNLPKNSTIELAAVDVEWRPARLSAALAGKLAERLAEPVCDFEALRLNETDLAGRLEALPVYGREVTLEGLGLQGWVVTGGAADAPAVLARCGTLEQAGTPLEDAAPLEGLTITGGFQVPLTGFAGQGASPVRLHLSGADWPLHETMLPAILRDGLGASAADQTPRLFYFPDYTATNPYQALMYRNMPDYQAEPGDVDAALACQDEEPGRRVVLHLHWLNPVLAGARNTWQAREKVREFLEKLSFFVHRGGVVLWTVHNLVSHNPVFRDVEIDLGQGVADLADRIHVHSRRLLPELATCYRLAEDKLVIEPHPNYINHYPNYVDRDRARAHLGLPDDARVFLFFGQLRPYKGIERLVRAFLEVQAKVDNAHLLIVGSPVHPFSPGMLSRRYEGLRNVHVIEGHVPDDRLQWYYNAADWVVLPYNAVLTSGSLLCALSFARPVVAPDLGMIADLLETGRNGILYDPEQEDALRDSLMQAARTGVRALAKMSANALESVRPLSWKRMGEGLEAALRDGPAATPVRIAFDDRPRDCLLLGKPFPPERPARTAVVILNYRHLDDVQRLVGTLEQSHDRDFDIYLVDNASPNLSVHDLAVSFPGLHVLRLPENLGYAAGNNAALRLIGDLDYEFVWILNPDMVVSPDALAQHVAAAQALPEVSIFGPVILRGGNERRVASAGGWISFEDGMSTGHMYAGESLSALPDTPYKVDFITGASVFLRKAVLERIGLIPEDYFLYFEETHWLLEAGRKGEACMVVPEIRLAHHKRSEESGLPARYYFYYYLRNSLIFAARMGGEEPNVTLARLRSGFIAAWLKKIGQRAPEQLALFQKLADQALADGLAGRTGPIDLIALELSVQDLEPLPAGALLEVLARGDGQGGLEGIIELGPEVNSPCTISVVSADGIIAQAQAEMLPRAPQQQRFKVSLPAWMHDGAAHRLELYVNASPVPDQVFDIRLPRPARRLKGRIDGIRQYVCTGWLWDQANPADRLPVEVLDDGKVVGHAMADVFRPDLKREGIGDGHAGFRIRLPRRYSDGRKHHLQLRLAGEEEIIHGRTVLDGEIHGGAIPEPVERSLRQLYQRRQVWLARHGLRDLPLGRHLEQVRAVLAARHRGRHGKVMASVIMPAYNRADTIAEAIASVRAQSHENWELLVVDDGSTDATAETVRALIEETGDSRIRLIELPWNKGVSAARNAGLEQARGDVIAYLDSDNDWDPDFLSIMIGELADQPDDVVSAYCGQNILHVLPADPADPEAPLVKERIAIRLGEFRAPLMENRNFIDLNCFVHDRRAVRELGGFNETLRRLVDWDLILRLSHRSAPHYVPALLSNYYFEKTGNQITRLENYGESLQGLRETIHGLRSARRSADSPAPGPVDMVLLGEGIAGGLAARVQDLLQNAAPARDVRLIVHATPEALEDLAGTGLADDPRLVIRDVSGLVQDLAEDGIALAADAFPMGACLDDALTHRRDGADLVLLQAQAFPVHGWLLDFARAQAACPEGGLFISRHTIRGNDPRVEYHVPFASRDMDACIAVSAARDNVLNPLLERRENLVELSQFEPFCVLIPAAVAAQLGTLDRGETSLEAVTGPMADFVRCFLGRKLVYCGNVQAMEMPLL